MGFGRRHFARPFAPCSLSQTTGSAIETTPCTAQGQPLHMLRAQPGDQLLDHLFVGRAERVFLGRCRLRPFSMSRSMSISILVARSSAEADLLTS